MYVKFKNPVQTNTNKKNKDLAIPLCGLLENINIEVFLNDRSQQGLWLINNPSQQGLWLIGHPANRTGFSRSATSERERAHVTCLVQIDCIIMIYSFHGITGRKRSSPSLCLLVHHAFRITRTLDNIRCNYGKIITR